MFDDADPGIFQYVSTRKVPWMSYLAEVVETPMTAADAAKAGGLDFNVVMRSVSFSGVDGKMKGAPNRKAIVREDTNTLFEIVSDTYAPLQFSEAFAFLDGINPEFVAAGLLKEGRQGFMVVQLPDEHKIHLNINDPHEMFVMVRTSHDRSRGIEVSVLPLRAKCMNSIAMASFAKGAPQRWSITHVGDVNGKMHNAEALIKGAHAYAAQYAEQVERLNKIHVDQDKARMILRNVVRESPKQGEMIEQIVQLWNDAPTVDLGNTGWGLVNAVSDHYEWNRKGGSAQSQILGIVEGVTTKAISRTAGALLSLAA